MAYGDNQEAIVRLDFELGENRELASLPDGSDFGNITEQLDAYYNDHAPFRSVLISINRRINSRLERVYSSRVQPVFIAFIDKRQQNAGGSRAVGWKEDTEAVSAGHGWVYAEETGGVTDSGSGGGEQLRGEGSLEGGK